MTREEAEKLEWAELVEVVLRQQATIEEQQATIEELETQVAQQQAQMAELAQQVGELQARLAEPAKTSTNSSVPSSQGPKPNRRKGPPGKKRGPPVGHVGRGRERQEPDVIIDCRPTACAACGADLRGVEGDRVGTSQVVELPPVEPVVVEAHCYAVDCPDCGHRTVADYPEGLEPERVFGGQIEALVSYLHQVHHLSYVRLQEVLRDVFGLEISLGALVNSIQRVAQQLEQSAEEIRETLRGSTVIGSDETGARVDGRNEWQWVFTTEQVSYHVIVPSRASSVIDEVLGEEAAPEVWVSDLWSAQLKNPAQQQQLCLAHQIRDLQYVIDADRCAWAYQLQELFRRAMRLAKQREHLSEEHYQQQVAALEAACDALLAQVVASEKGRALQRRYLKHRPELFVFLYRADVPPDNNASERALRNSVVHRKVSGGFRSEWGAAAYATVTTVIETAKKQGQRVWAALRAHLAPSATAAAAAG
jgi:transposase